MEQKGVNDMREVGGGSQLYTWVLDAMRTQPLILNEYLHTTRLRGSVSSGQQRDPVLPCRELLCIITNTTCYKTGVTKTVDCYNF